MNTETIRPTPHWTPRMLRRALTSVALAGMIATITACGGSDDGDDGTQAPASPQIPSWRNAKQFVVEMFTEAGKKITEKSKNLSDAAIQMWQRFRPIVDTGVVVDPDDPSKGRLKGRYDVRIVVFENGKKDEIKLTFIDPPMVRESIEAPWEIDPSYQADVVETVRADVKSPRNSDNSRREF